MSRELNAVISVPPLYRRDGGRFANELRRHQPDRNFGVVSKVFPSGLSFDA
jgi:hypothetical protein